MEESFLLYEWKLIYLKSMFHINVQGEPYLHIDGDMLVVPGATKYTARVLVFDSQEGTLKRVRDLVHRKLWLLSAVIGHDLYLEYNAKQ